MDDKIYVAHPFYFPTQVVMVDDDPDFLDGVSLMLDSNLSYRLYQSASEALDYVNSAHQQVKLVQRCYSNYKTGHQDSDSLSHVDIGKLHEEIYNSARFKTSSTVVVDYSMPEMNGLEFLMSLTNPFIRKVLLTGQADMELAIKAFNKQLIHQFIDKHDPKLKQLLNSTITSFQDQYFRSSFKLITEPIIANNHDTFLTDNKFRDLFEEILLKTKCVEYYLIDAPHTGYLLADSAGKRRCLLIYKESILLEHADELSAVGAPDNLVDDVRKGELIPAYEIQSENLASEHPCIKNWENHYFPGIKIESKINYFVTILADKNLPQPFQGEIIPYSDFIESNSLNREILH
jgi:FixJ family two-component response regulator